MAQRMNIKPHVYDKGKLRNALYDSSLRLG